MFLAKQMGEKRDLDKIVEALGNDYGFEVMAVVCKSIMDDEEFHITDPMRSNFPKYVRFKK